MAVDFGTDVENAILDQIETIAGTAPVLYIYSGAQPAATTDSDPSGELISVVLPSDWADDAALEAKSGKGLVWSGTATASGNAASFRLKTSGGTTVMQGSVSSTSGSGDIKLNTITINENQTVRITAFAFSVPTNNPTRIGSVSITQSGNTVAATGVVYTPAPVSPKGTWTRLAYVNAGGVVQADLDAWAQFCTDVARDRLYISGWGSVIFAFNRSTGAYIETLGPITATVDFHNRSAAYESVNDRVWFGGGTGVPVGFSYWDIDGETGATLGAGINEPNYYPFMWFDETNERLVSVGGIAKTFALNPIGSAWINSTAGNAPNPAYPATAYSDVYYYWKTVYDSTRDRFLTFRDYRWTQSTGELVYDPGKIVSINGALTTWTQITTTGPYPGPFSCYVYDPVNDQVIAWTGNGTLAGGSKATGPVRATYILSLDTLQWSEAANNDDGDTVPPGYSLIGNAHVWDEQRNRMILLLQNGVNQGEVWAYYPPSEVTGTLTQTQAGDTLYAQAFMPGAGIPPITGTVQQFDLPQIVSGALIDGVNYAGLYFSSGYTGAGSNSKHVAQAYCPTNNRVYIQGGDATNSIQATDSALDATWSMDVDTGEWRFECGRPNVGYVAPSALQDGLAIEWMPSKAQFVMWPGAYAPYGFSVAQYATGHWFYDPFTPAATPSGYTAPQGTYTQFIASPLVDFGDSGSGVYDRDNDLIFAVRESWGTGSTSVWVCKRFSLASQSWLPDVNLNVSGILPGGGYNWSLFSASRYVRVGRKVYFIGVWYNGATGIPAFWSVDMDTFVVNELAPPPTSGVWNYPIKEQRLCASNGKVIWPHITDGMNGTILGIYVYDPGTNIWYKETQQVTTNCNSVCTMYDHPEGWAGLCGGFQRRYTLLKY